VTCQSSTKADVASQLMLGLITQAQQQLTQVFSPHQKVLVLAGPTAVGKSEMALHLAKQLGGEIVNGDSCQIYRGMNIGTAKPTKRELDEVMHHLVDINEVSNPFNVVDFYYFARRAIQSIHARNRIPIVVGGSGFYLHTLIYGPPSGPPSIPEVRQHFEKEWGILGAEAMYEQLKTQDPTYAKTITKADRQKIIRGLEIIAVTGKPVSDLDWHKKETPLHYDFRCWFLHRSREKIYERINLRCDTMLSRGLVHEVEGLLKMGIEKNTSAAQAIGYRQTLEYLRSAKTEEDYNNYVHSFKVASRRYAKQQFTWFRKEPLFRWLDVELHDRETAASMILNEFSA
jgi:tRNA dimethylallyltransferase